MSFLVRTVFALVLAAGVIGFFCYRMSSDAALHAAAMKRDTMEWLRADFHLTEAQFAAVQKLHVDYAPTCEEHCREIQAARKMLTTAGADDAVARSAAEQKLQELRLSCELAMIRHVRQVAAVMSPEDGRRYVELVSPKIVDFDHTAAPNLQLDVVRK